MSIMQLADGAKAEHETWWEADGLQQKAYEHRYIAGLYWAITTMTTVGYGDILPRSDAERVYATASMLLGATVFG